MYAHSAFYPFLNRYCPFSMNSTLSKGIIYWNFIFLYLPFLFIFKVDFEVIFLGTQIQIGTE